MRGSRRYKPCRNRLRKARRHDEPVLHLGEIVLLAVEPVLHLGEIVLLAVSTYRSCELASR